VELDLSFITPPVDGSRSALSDCVRLLFDSNGHLAGAIGGFYQEPNRFWLQTLVVTPEQQGMGYGKELMNALFSSLPTSVDTVAWTPYGSSTAFYHHYLIELGMVYTVSKSNMFQVYPHLPARSAQETAQLRVYLEQLRARQLFVKNKIADIKVNTLNTRLVVLDSQLNPDATRSIIAVDESGNWRYENTNIPEEHDPQFVRAWIELQSWLTNTPTASLADAANHERVLIPTSNLQPPELLSVNPEVSARPGLVAPLFIMMTVMALLYKFRNWMKNENHLYWETFGNRFENNRINEEYHNDKPKELGLDIHTMEGNVAFAKYLYETQGTSPWNASKSCWNK
jgi:GNAT superfamily N-acetyltransferase